MFRPQAHQHSTLQSEQELDARTTPIGFVHLGCLGVRTTDEESLRPISKPHTMLE